MHSTKKRMRDELSDEESASPPNPPANAALAPGPGSEPAQAEKQDGALSPSSLASSGDGGTAPPFTYKPSRVWARLAQVFRDADDETDIPPLPWARRRE